VFGTLRRGETLMALDLVAESQGGLALVFGVSAPVLSLLLWRMNASRSLLDSLRSFGWREPIVSAPKGEVWYFWVCGLQFVLLLLGVAFGVAALGSTARFAGYVNQILMVDAPTSEMRELAKLVLSEMSGATVRLHAVAVSSLVLEFLIGLLHVMIVWPKPKRRELMEQHTGNAFDSIESEWGSLAKRPSELGHWRTDWREWAELVARARDRSVFGEPVGVVAKRFGNLNTTARKV
jgi:hypothetical protein